jgi:hypothetical protein
VAGPTRDRTLAMLDVLAGRYAFAEVSALVAAGFCDHCRTPLQLADLQQLCAFGQRLIDLDAEDVGEADAATDANVDHSVADRVTGDAVPADLVSRSNVARMPRSSSETGRGALSTLRPAFSLLLEAIAVRWRRRETSALVAALHIVSEYLPVLVWEPVLGHAADPARMPASVGGDGSLWGLMDSHDCPHSRPQKSAAGRALRVSSEPDIGWQSYLDRQHSIVAEALRVCGSECRYRCTVLTRHTDAEQKMLAAGCRTAGDFTGSTLIQLRHSAPVGHGFGVPSRREVLTTWMHTRDVLGRLQPAVLVEDGYPLPGLPSLVSALAGVPIAPDTLILETMTELRAALA